MSFEQIHASSEQGHMSDEEAFLQTSRGEAGKRWRLKLGIAGSVILGCAALILVVFAPWETDSTRSIVLGSVVSKQKKWKPEKETVELSNGNTLEIAFKPNSPGKARCAVFMFFTKTRDTLIEELSKKPGEDWVVAYGHGSNSKGIENFVKLIRKPVNAEKMKINPDCIALLGYSKGGIRAGAATKALGREGVKGMIYLNSGNKNFKTTGKDAAKSPYADYLLITGMAQNGGWVNGNAELVEEIKAAGGWVKQVQLEGVGHTNWRKEKTRVFNAFVNFLINRVRKR